MKKISSKSNQWIKLAVQLKQKKYRDKYNLFLMEGIRSAEDAQNQKIKDVICFIQDNKTDESSISSIIEKGKELHWLFLSVDETLFSSISDTEHGQGIILIVKKREYNTDNLLEKLDGKYVYLDTIQDPGNLGTIIRTSAAAGCGGVLLSEGCADPYSEKVVRSSMGSILRIPIYENVTDTFLQKLKCRHHVLLIGTTVSGGIYYKDIDNIENAVFIFGNEGNGIRKELLETTDCNIYIPLARAVESLNVSAAAAVILFHYFDC